MSFDYFEVTFANGRNVIAHNAPESYVKDCLDNTGARFNKTTEERAQQINCYYGVNEGTGWQLLRMHALEAKMQTMQQKSNFIK